MAVIAAVHQANGASTKFLNDEFNDGYNPNIRGITTLGSPFLKWTYTAVNPGAIRSTPAVDSAGNIYFASDYCNLTCIDSNGNQVWNRELTVTGGGVDPRSRTIITSSPLLSSDGFLYVTASNFSADGKNVLYVLYYTTGAIRSVYFGLGNNINPDADPSLYLAGASSSPIIADNQVIIGSVDGSVYSFVTGGGNTVNWNTDLGEAIWSSPATNSAEDTVYINCGDGAVYALSTLDGSQKWSHPIHPSSVRSSPVVTPDGLVLVYEDGPYNKLAFLDPDSGDPVFDSDSFLGNITDISPAIGPSGIIYVQTSLYGRSNALIHSINPDGSLNWTTPYSMISTIASDGHTSTSSLKVGSDGTIYGITDGPNLTAIQDHGTSASQLWTLSFQGTDNHLYGSPVIAQDGTIYVTSDRSHVYAITGAITPPCTGIASTSWAMRGQNIYHTGRNNYQGITSNPALNWSIDFMNLQMTEPSIGPDGTLYAASSDGNLYAFNYTGSTGTTGGTGTLLWAYYTGLVQAPPAIGNDGTIFVVSDDGTYSFSSTGSSGGTGIIQWVNNEAYSYDTSPTIGDNGIVYVGSPDNTLYALFPQGSAGRTGIKHWTIDLGSIVSSPAIGLDGTVYVGTQSGVNAVTFTGGTGDINGTGTVKWVFDKTGNYNTPSVGSDGTVYVTSATNEKIFALYSTGTIGGTGTILWSYGSNSANGVFTNPTIGSDGTIYVGSSTGTFYALTYTGATNATGGTGTVKWSFGNTLSFVNPATIGGDGTVYVTATGASGGFVYGLGYSGSTGNCLWQYPIDTNPFAGGNRPYAVLDQNGSLYVPTTTGALYALIQTPPPIPTAPTGGATGLASTPWAMVGHDIYHTGRSSYQGVITNPVTYWSSKTGSRTSIQPIIGNDGTIYVCSDIGGLYALTYTGSSAATGGTGTNKWVTLPYNSLSVTPAIGNDGTIYVGASDGGMFAVSTTGGTGTLAWVYKTSGQIQSSPAIGNDGTVYIGCNNSILYAFYPAGTTGGTGVLKWTYATNGPIISSPAIGQNGCIYLGSDSGGLTAVTFTGPTGSVQSTGTKLWSYYTSNTFNTPSVGSAGTVYVTSPDTNYLYALNPTGTAGGTGILKWSFPLRAVSKRTTPTIGSDETIYVGSTGTFYALTYTGATNATGGRGTVKWSFKTNTSSFNAPATIGADGTVYVASGDKILYALTYTGPTGTTGGTGTVLWEYPTTAPINNAPTIGADGTVYAMANDGTVYAITTQQSPTGPVNNICFLKGTYILTTQGEVLVENLTPQHHVLSHGDIVNGRVAHQYSVSRVKNMIHFTAHNLDRFSRPICFKQGAVGHMTPNRDLYISPLHCLLIGDELVQAYNVVNGTTITYDMTCSSAEYYHIVLEKHSVIYSNNMATESCSFVELGQEMFQPNTLETTKSIQVY